MSNSGIVLADPFVGLEGAPEGALRDHAAMLVKGNVLSVADANTILAGKNFAPLNATALDYAQSQKDSLLNDAGFMERYSRNEASAVAQLYKLDILITQSSGNLTDRAPDASQYDALRREIGYAVKDQAAYDTYSTELTGLASSLEMPPANATALAEQHFAAIKATADMDAVTLADWGDRQTATLVDAVGIEAIKEASKTLSAKAGREIDIFKIVKSNGSSLALGLIFQAQSLKGVK
jgi:hypothetical protein